MSTDIFNSAKKLGFGLMRLPLNNPAKNDADINMEELKNMVDMFISRGFTYFDTALMYCGEASEAVIKEALVDRYPREAFTLTDKLHASYIKTEDDPDRVFNGQLAKTGVDFFDYYLIHDVNVDSIRTYNKLNIFDWIKNKKAKGKIKHIGISFHDTPELLDKVLSEHPEIEMVQLQINYLDYDNSVIQSRSNYETATAHNKPVLVMEPVKGGTLVNLPTEISDMYKAYNPEASMASWAIRFAASHENVRIVLSGMSNISQLEDNTSYMQDFQPLNDEEKALIDKAAQMLKDSTAIPCTGCSYCTKGCPLQIPIPKYFALYNAQLREDPENKKGWTPQMNYYANMTINSSKAGECVKCGQCEGICPQHLPVTKYLEDVAGIFE